MYLHQNVSFDINFSVEEGNFQYEIDNMLGLSFHFFPVFFSPLFIVIFVILHLSRRPAGRPSSSVPHKALQLCAEIAMKNIYGLKKTL